MSTHTPIVRRVARRFLAEVGAHVEQDEYEINGIKLAFKPNGEIEGRVTAVKNDEYAIHGTIKLKAESGDLRDIEHDLKSAGLDWHDVKVHASVTNAYGLGKPGEKHAVLKHVAAEVYFEEVQRQHEMFGPSKPKPVMQVHSPGLGDLPIAVVCDGTFSY